MKKYAATDLKIRRARPKDISDILDLFVQTVRSVCRDDYTPGQINAWTSSAQDPGHWKEKISAQLFLVAQINDQIVGFASLEKGTYLDLFYVHKDYQGFGIGSSLLSALEHEVEKSENAEITSDVSKTALSFFESNGFSVVKEQTVRLKGIAITNFKMTKKL